MTLENKIPHGQSRFLLVAYPSDVLENYQNCHHPKGQQKVLIRPNDNFGLAIHVVIMHDKVIFWIMLSENQIRTVLP